MIIKPENNVVMVRIRPRAEKVGNLFVAPNPKNEDPADKKGDLPVLADVLAVGPGHRMEDGTLIPMRIKVGQVVLLNGLGGIPVLLPDTGQTVWFLREKEFLAVVEDAPTVIQES